MTARDIDIAILGGGLAGGLIALALAEERPGLSLLLVESGETFGGNHVWSFFSSDIDGQDRWLVEPLVAASWDGYVVRFPGHARTLGSQYNSITSERLDAALRKALPDEARLTGAKVQDAGPERFTLADGRSFHAGGVIDARGASGLPHMAGGWQKFLGRMLELDQPHGLERPIVMDATVAQEDGYRFVYCLPFSENEVFVEDTYYSDAPDLDVPDLRERIAAYAKAQGWQVKASTREETGVLPVIADGNFEAFWRENDPLIAKAGARAALIQPLTSYSLPDAVRFARRIVELPDGTGAALAKASYDWASRHWREGSFYRMLAKMLFSAAEPLERYRVLERFYRLPEGLIERFYAGQSNTADRMRILAGKPPVPLGKAIAALSGNGMPLAPLDPQG